MSAAASASSPTVSRYHLAAALTFLLLVCLPVRFWIGPVQMTGLRLFLALTAIPLLWIWLRNPSLRRDPVTWCFAAAITWGALAISQTSPSHLLENTGALWLELFCAYLLGRICIRYEQIFARFILAAAIALLVLLPLTLFESQTGAPPLIQAIRHLPLITSVDVVSIEPRLGLERAQVVFAHPIHFGLFATTCFALALVGLRAHLNLGARVALASVALISTFLSLSSGPLLALVVQACLLVWVWLFGAERKAWLALIITLAVLYIAIDLASDRTPIRVFMSYATFSAHNAFWRGLIFEWGMVNVWNNPIFGIGFNDWERPSFMVSGSVDNYWLATAMKYGLPTLLLLVAGVWIACRRAMFMDATPSPLRLAWMLTMVSIILALCTVHVWTAIHAYLFFLLGAGQFAGESASERNTAKSSQKHLYTRNLGSPGFTQEGLPA